MDTTVKFPSTYDGRRHKRTTSSVLKSIVAPRSQKHDLSATDIHRPITRDSARDLPLLPPSHPDFQKTCIEFSQNSGRPRSPMKKSIEIYDDPNRLQKPKKSKSSTNLSAFLSRPKSSKASKKDDPQLTKDKENQTPPGSATAAPTPIWAQFAHQGAQGSERLQRVPLKDQWNFEDDIALYTPKEHSPSKQRDFLGYEPTLGRRPKSAYFAPSPSMDSFAETLSGLRETSNGRNDITAPTLAQNKQPTRDNVERKQKSSTEAKSPSRRSSTEKKRKDDGTAPLNVHPTTTKNGTRVMAAVAAWNGKSKELVTEVKEIKFDSKAIESAFEALLVGFRVTLFSGIVLLK